MRNKEKKSLLIFNFKSIISFSHQSTGEPDGESAMLSSVCVAVYSKP